VNDAVLSFARDLRDAGASESDISDLSRLYDRALTNPSDSGWEQFYRATFAVASRTLGQAVPQSREAVASIARLLEDDLGTALFGAVSLDDIAREARPQPLHPQHGAHHHG
jgi:hypothetical protein